MATQWKSLTVLHEVQYVGVTLGVTLQIPTDGAVGFAPGCLLILYNETNNNGSPYINTSGTQKACRFRPVGGGPFINDVVRTTPAGKQIPYVNATRTDSIIQALADAQSGDVVTIAPGTFTFPNRPPAPPGSPGPGLVGAQKMLIAPGVTVQGAGRGITILQGAWQIDPIYNDEIAGQPVFSLSDGVIVQDLSLIVNATNNINEDGGGIGWNSATPTSGVSATLRRLYVSANDWAIYGWTLNTNTTVEDCEVHCGRQCISANDSAGGQTLTVRRCQLYANAMLSQSVGGSSDHTTACCAGISHRGGILKVYDTEFYSTGPTNTDGHTAVDGGSNPISWATYTTGITDAFYQGPGNPSWEIRNCHFATSSSVTLPNPAAPPPTVPAAPGNGGTADLRMRMGAGGFTNTNLKLIGGDGSGGSNAISKLLV